jgi:CheY-like chemotaxis protein
MDKVRDLMRLPSQADESSDVHTADTTVPDTFGSWPQSSVLVVDDEPGMRSFLTRALSTRCGRVASAASVEEATRLIDDKPFDLLILDIALPGKSGVEWLHELRALGYHQDVILITAFADLDTAIGALRGGASDFILKPFRIDRSAQARKLPAQAGHRRQLQYRAGPFAYGWRIASAAGYSDPGAAACALAQHRAHNR